MNLNFLCAFNPMMIVYVIVAILVFLLMIMIHELGHYTAGRILKFKINEFSIGFGKAIFLEQTNAAKSFQFVFSLLEDTVLLKEKTARGQKKSRRIHKSKTLEANYCSFHGSVFQFSFCNCFFIYLACLLWI